MVPATKFDQDLQFLMQCLREVLQELKHPELIAYLPWLEGQTKADGLEPAQTFRVVQLLSISFQLLGMVEENINVQNRRAEQATGQLERESGLWPWAFSRLKEAGFSEQEILQRIQELSVEPVLTAHPTESKRATVLQHHRELYLQLVKLENQMWTPIERDWLKDEIKAILERLWRTGEIYRQRPEVSLELRNVMHYLRHVFPEILPWMDHRFERSFEEAQATTELDYMQGHYPKFELGTWVGGDRDGHPLVTAEITAKALHDLRLNALIVLRHKLSDLAKKLSLSDQVQAPPLLLQERLEHYAKTLPQLYQRAVSRNIGESFRILVNIMIERLPIEVVRDHATQLGDRPECYRTPDDILPDFSCLKAALTSIHAKRLVQSELKYAVRTLQTLGFHSARLDIRQNSQFHELALQQLLQKAAIPGAESYPDWQLSDKLQFLAQELQTLRPFCLRKEQFSAQAEAVLSSLKVVRDFALKHGYQGIGSYIVSMTHHEGDLFTVYLLLREAGLALLKDGKILCPIPVVPLFETIDDLKASTAILRAFLQHPVTQESLKLQASLQGWSRPRQQVMVGYSDSCKDGGILASQWHLHRAEAAMAEVGEAMGVDICFFHGRGGTVSRGAGPVHRFLQALPRGAIKGSLRMTEQGETIARKYANHATAVYNMELMQASLIAESLLSQKKNQLDPAFIDLMNFLSDLSQDTYHDLISAPGFISFFRGATPIDVLEHSRLGSRPPKRTGQASIEDLRAIPWVFAWNQSRFYLPSWYGVGTALVALKETRPELFTMVVQRHAEFELLNYVLFNVETTVASVDEELMQAYAALVPDPELRKRFMQKIISEYQRTRQVLIEIFGATVEERRPHVIRTIQLRDHSLHLLHRLQISQLRQLRESTEGSAEHDSILESLLLTVNAIAGGLRNTG